MTGTILIEKGTRLPESLRLEDESYPSAWMPVRDTPSRHELEQELATAGWTLFYMAGGIRASAFGFDRQKMVRAALKRLVANTRLNNCNCMEIDEVTTHSFLGLLYVSVSAHSRHVQKGIGFSRQ